MNWGEFKDPVSHMCFADIVVAFCFLTQEMAGLNLLTEMTNILVTEFNEDIW